MLCTPPRSSALVLHWVPSTHPWHPPPPTPPPPLPHTAVNCLKRSQHHLTYVLRCLTVERMFTFNACATTHSTSLPAFPSHPAAGGNGLLLPGQRPSKFWIYYICKVFVNWFFRLSNCQFSICWVCVCGCLCCLSSYLMAISQSVVGWMERGGRVQKRATVRGPFRTPSWPVI